MILSVTAAPDPRGLGVVERRLHLAVPDVLGDQARDLVQVDPSQLGTQPLSARRREFVPPLQHVVLTGPMETLDQFTIRSGLRRCFTHGRPVSGRRISTTVSGRENLPDATQPGNTTGARVRHGCVGNRT